MEISSTRWISELEMEDADPFMNEFEINPFDFSFDEFKFEQSSLVPPSMAVAERPAKQLKVENGGGNQCSQIFGPNNNYNKAVSASTSSHLISFENSNSKNWSNNEYNMKRGSGSGTTNPMHARDHVIAERKRREKLTQRFIALSALIPGLNKVDKASILGGAVRHVKELQERLKVVEDQEQSAAVVHVKTTSRGRPPVSSSDDDDNMSSTEENSFFGCGGGAVPEIEARMSNKDVLVRIHCHKRRKGCLSYLLAKIENLNLTILNSTALPFAHSKLDITIVAQVDEGFCMTVEDVVKNLRQALLDFN